MDCFLFLPSLICSKGKTFFSKFSIKFLKFYFIPKDSTQQDLFLSRYPKFDGRGIKIAIIDGGIDVSLEGLQTTSEGHPKIIDCFDFTGVGDVDTSIVKEMDSKSVLIGLSGRKLKIPSKWKNPSGKWHLGLKSLFKPSTSNSTSEKLPEIDSIVWFNGEKWCACIETFGNLKNAKILTNFRDSHEFGILCLNKMELAYCVTLHDEGNLLEIFTPYSDHGSCVAQIAAAHFPRKPERNGLAPGAQIIYMNTTHPEKENYEINYNAFKKAILKCAEMKVDIINYSCSYIGDEEMSKLIREVIEKHNILFFKSAGNRGPFYTSVLDSSMHHIEDIIFTIGAVLTSKIRKEVFLVRKTKKDKNVLPPVVAEYSSRGPGHKGSRGVDFVAPCSAITDSSRFVFGNKKGPWLKRRHGGTSIASPNAAGAVACLLSALKANSIQYSPFTIKFALFKTAYLPENGIKFEFGHGIIQINNAFDYCKREIDFTKIPKYLPESGGICFIEDDEKTIDLSRFIQIESDEAAKKWTLELSPKAENFIKLSKIDENNTFTIKVDKTNLEAGSLNYAEIFVMDSNIGSIFNIPVNVVKVIKITEIDNLCFQKEITLHYENLYHIILHPIFEASKKYKIKITALEDFVTNIQIQYVAMHKDGLDEVEKTIKILKFNRKTTTAKYSFLIEKKVYHEICIHQQIGFAKPSAKFKLEFCTENEQKELAL